MQVKEQSLGKSETNQAILKAGRGTDPYSVCGHREGYSMVLDLCPTHMKVAWSALDWKRGAAAISDGVGKRNIFHIYVDWGDDRELANHPQNMQMVGDPLAGRDKGSHDGGIRVLRVVKIQAAFHWDALCLIVWLVKPEFASRNIFKFQVLAD